MHRWATDLVVSVALITCLSGSFASAQTFEGQLLASDAAFGDTLGHTIDVSGDTIVVGARADNSNLGSAYVYRRAGGGAWSQEAKLADALGATGQQLGFSVSISGDVIAAGAPEPFNPFNPPVGSGSVYIYRRAGVNWSEEDQFTPTGGQQNDQFGYSVSIDGNRAAIGARGDQPSGAGQRFDGQGSAFIFENSGGNWTQDEKIVAGDAAAGDRFGSAISLSGDFVVIGAPGDDDNGVDSGSAYVFRRQGSNWVLDGKLTASDGAADDAFGESVSIDGDIVAVGAATHDTPSSDGGAVYLYRRSGGSWSQEDKVEAADTGVDKFFGAAVDVEGDELVVGSSGDEAVYRFAHAGGNWSQVGKTSAPVAGTALMGFSVARGADFFATGAPLSTGGGVNFSGAANVWCDNPGPTLTSINPTQGVATQTTPVTLTGLDFSTAKAVPTVTFGGVPATGVTVVSDTSITCNAPTGTQGASVNVVVTQEGASDTLFGAFTYVGMTVTSINPSSGPASGGTSVTLSGALFATDGSTAVTFGGVPASIGSVTSSTIVCTAPAGSVGSTVTVAVTGNTGADSLVSAYTYVGMSLTSLNPSSGPSGGGTSVTLTGTLFATDGSTSVTFGGASAGLTSVTSTTIVCVSPAGTNGATVDVQVSGNNGSDSLLGAFTYQSVSIVSVSPATANFTTGAIGTINLTNGTNLGDTTILLGGQPATVLTANASTATFTIAAVAAPTGDALDVMITNSSGTDTVVGAFTYSPGLITQVSGNTTSGGAVLVSWAVDAAAPPSQIVSMWLADPLMPPLNLNMPGVAGTMKTFPMFFLVQQDLASTSPLNLVYGPLPAAVAGFPFQLQLIASDEGGVNGSFSNVATFVIP